MSEEIKVEVDVAKYLAKVLGVRSFKLSFPPTVAQVVKLSGIGISANTIKTLTAVEKVVKKLVSLVDGVTLRLIIKFNGLILVDERVISQSLLPFKLPTISIPTPVIPGFNFSTPTPSLTGTTILPSPFK
jgi:hypothetical protein